MCDELVGNFNIIESRSILPTILSCIVEMKTKINFQKQHLPIDLDLSSCQCIAKVKEGPV